MLRGSQLTRTRPSPKHPHGAADDAQFTVDFLAQHAGHKDQYATSVRPWEIVVPANDQNAPRAKRAPSGEASRRSQ